MENIQLAVTDEQQLTLTFGQRLRGLRAARNMHQRELARRAQISATYVAQIEKGRAPAPPRETAERILGALQPEESERRALLMLAAAERGSNEADEQLPAEIRALVHDLRRHANELPDPFIRKLRTVIREAVK